MSKKTILISFLMLTCLVNIGCSNENDDIDGLVRINDYILPRSLFEERLTIVKNQIASSHGLDLDAAENKEMLLRVKQRLIEDLIWERILILEAKDLNVYLSTEEAQKAFADFKASFASQAEFNLFLDRNGHTAESYQKYLQTQLSIENLLQKIIEHITITAEEVKNYFNQNADQYHYQESIAVRQLVLSTKQQAEELKHNFSAAELFEKYALEMEDLGYLNRNDLDKQFAETAFELARGELHGPVASSEGFHLFEVYDFREARKVTLDEVSPQVKADLKSIQQEQIIQDYYNELFKKSDVEFLDNTFEN